MRDRLTRQEWENLCRRVFERDLYQAWLRTKQGVSFARWLTIGNPCVASFLDPRSGPCRGEIEFDHVPGRGETTMQRKAPDDERHLQSICSWHHGTSRTGGGWATSEAARERSRDYLASLYPEDPAPGAPA